MSGRKCGRTGTRFQRAAKSLKLRAIFLDCTIFASKMRPRRRRTRENQAKPGFGHIALERLWRWTERVFQNQRPGTSETLMSCPLTIEIEAFFRPDALQHRTWIERPVVVARFCRVLILSFTQCHSLAQCYSLQQCLSVKECCGPGANHRTRSIPDNLRNPGSSVRLTSIEPGFSWNGRIGQGLPISIQLTGAVPQTELALRVVASDPYGHLCEAVVATGKAMIQVN